MVSGIQEVTSGLANISNGSDLISSLVGHLSVNWQLLAQEVQDPKVLDQIQNFFKNFIQSGQVWALLIGLVVGYLVRGVTR